MASVADQLEALGEKEWGLALPSFEASLRAWEEASSVAVRLKDPALLERSRLERARITAFSRDPSLFESLQPTGSGPGSSTRNDALSRLLSSAPPRGQPPPESLQPLSRFFASARSRYLRAPQAEARDVPLLLEAEALVHQALASAHQLKADSFYREALKALEGQKESTRAKSQKVRLLYKLRDFDGARSAGRELSRKSALLDLPLDERTRHLRVLLDIARFEGDTRGASALQEELRTSSSKAEEVAKPSIRFESPLQGSGVDLAQTAETLVDLVANWSLAPRETALLSYLAGLCLIELGEYALAEEILPLLPPGLDEPWLSASVSARLGYVRLELGDYESALHSFEAAQASVLGLCGSESFRARLSLNASRAHLSLGQLDRAREEALRVALEKGLSGALKARARILLGDVFYEKAREKPELLSDARAAYEAASRELDEPSQRTLPARDIVELQAALAINEANLLRAEALREKEPERGSHWRRAIELQDKALRAADQAGLHGLAGAAAGNLGELYLEAGDLATAKSFVEWALGRAVELHSSDSEWRCHWYLARIAAAEGPPSIADLEYERALQILGSYRSRVLEADKKIGFLNDKMAFFRDLVRHDMAGGRPDLALGAAEQGKARFLVDSLGWRFLSLSSSSDTQLYRDFVNLLSRSERSREGAVPVLLGVKPKGPSYEELRSRLLALKARFEKGGPSLRALLDGDPSDGAAIARDLPRGTALVEYYSLGTSLVAFLALDGKVEVVPLPVSLAELDSLVAAYLRGGASDKALAQRLYSSLVGPMEAKIAGRRLILVPFGALHQLPFETLRDSRGGYMVSRWEMAYLPCASLLKFFKGKNSGAAAASKLLAIVDPDTDYNHDGKPDLPPLPFARDEVLGFASRFQERQILIGPAALKAECQRFAPLFDVIHCACHGEFYPARPWESALFLSGAAADSRRKQDSTDGRLRACEVYGMDLRRSRLVALSGCETGRSQVFPGDDTVSLATAFIHSGASSLLVSLWKVEDQATAALMKSFYRKWIQEGKDKAKALRESKLELLESPYSQPRQWAAFVLIGQP